MKSFTSTFSRKLHNWQNYSPFKSKLSSSKMKSKLQQIRDSPKHSLKCQKHGCQKNLLCVKHPQISRCLECLKENKCCNDMNLQQINSYKQQEEEMISKIVKSIEQLSLSTVECYRNPKLSQIGQALDRLAKIKDKIEVDLQALENEMIYNSQECLSFFQKLMEKIKLFQQAQMPNLCSVELMHRMNGLIHQQLGKASDFLDSSLAMISSKHSTNIQNILEIFGQFKKNFCMDHIILKTIKRQSFFIDHKKSLNQTLMYIRTTGEWEKFICSFFLENQSLRKRKVQASTHGSRQRVNSADLNQLSIQRQKSLKINDSETLHCDKPRTIQIIQKQQQLNRFRVYEKNLKEAFQVYQSQLQRLSKSLCEKTQQCQQYQSQLKQLQQAFFQQPDIQKQKSEQKPFTFQINSSIFSVVSVVKQTSAHQKFQSTLTKLTRVFNKALTSLWTGLLLNFEKQWLISKIQQRNLKQVNKFEIKFIASHHRFDPKSYHNNCENVRNLLTIIKTQKGRLVGGFSDEQMDSQKISQTAFLFNAQRKLYMPIKKGNRATIKETGYGPIFGMQSDLRISYQNIFSNHHIAFSSYQKVNIEGLSPQESLLGGTEDKVVEYQVFEVIFKE